MPMAARGKRYAAIASSVIGTSAWRNWRALAAQVKV
ncbi:MAG: hypothetical protein JWM94_2214 [Sphingomonas bacterium]|nr:hypothetical protein [Sphingomonas bacterium]